MGDVVAFVAGEILVLIAFFVIKSVIVKAFTSVNKNGSWIWIACSATCTGSCECFLCQCLGILRQGGIFCGQLHIAVRHGKGGNFFGVIGQFQAFRGLPGRKE